MSDVPTTDADPEGPSLHTLIDYCEQNISACKIQLEQNERTRLRIEAALRVYEDCLAHYRAELAAALSQQEGKDRS